MGFKLQKSIFRKELVYEIGDCDSLQSDGSNEYLPDYLHYNTSWDWLMPVVEKIERDSTVRIDNDTVFILSKGYSTLTQFNDNKINMVYNAVVEFIKWYNQQKS